MRYGPRGSRMARKLPSAPVTTTLSKLVAVFSRVTVAPGRTPPPSSVTIPSITPVVAWDWAKSAGIQARTKTTARRRTPQRRDIVTPFSRECQTCKTCKLADDSAGGGGWSRRGDVTDSADLGEGFLQGWRASGFDDQRMVGSEDHNREPLVVLLEERGC